METSIGVDNVNENIEEDLENFQLNDNIELNELVSKLEIEDHKSESKNNKILIDMGNYLHGYVRDNNMSIEQYKNNVEIGYLHSKFGNTIATTSKLILTSTGHMLNKFLHKEGQPLKPENCTIELTPSDIYFVKDYSPKCYVNVSENIDTNNNQISLTATNDGNSVSPQLLDSLATLYDTNIHSKSADIQISYMKDNIQNLLNAKISYSDIHKMPFKKFMATYKIMVASHKISLISSHKFYKMLIQTAYQSEYLILERYNVIMFVLFIVGYNTNNVRSIYCRLQ